MSKKPRQVDNGPSQHMSAKECSLRAFCTSALLVFFNACLTSVKNHLKRVRWTSRSAVLRSVSPAVCWLAEAMESKHRLFMINRVSSTFWRQLTRVLHPRALRSSYWLPQSSALHFVSVRGSLRDKQARQSYKVKYLGLALALQVSAIILLRAFLPCWIIMDVRVYACHRSSVGGGNPREVLGQRNVCFSCYVI